MTGYTASKHTRWLDPAEKDFPRYRLCDDCTEKFDADDLARVSMGFYDVFLCRECLAAYELKNKIEEDSDENEIS